MKVSSRIHTGTATRLTAPFYFWKRYYPFSDTKIQSDITYNKFIKVVYYCCGRDFIATQHENDDIVPQEFSNRLRVVKGKETDFSVSIGSYDERSLLIPSPLKVLINVSNCDYYKVRIGNTINLSTTPDKSIVLTYRTTKRYILLTDIGITLTVFTNAPAKPTIKIQLIPAENCNVKMYSTDEENTYRYAFHIAPTAEILN